MAILCEMCGNPTDYVSVGRLSKLLGVTDITIREWIKRGKLDAVRVDGVNSKWMYKIPVTAIIPILEARQNG